MYKLQNSRLQVCRIQEKSFTFNRFLILAEVAAHSSDVICCLFHYFEFVVLYYGMSHLGSIGVTHAFYAQDQYLQGAEYSWNLYKENCNVPRPAC